MKLNLFFIAVTMLCLLCVRGMAVAAPSVTVHGVATYTDAELQVSVYADIAECDLKSFGVSLSYDPADLTLVNAEKNEMVWYLGDGLINHFYLDPESDGAGNIVLIGGRLDISNPRAGVTGNSILLGQVTFTRNNANIPAFSLSMGRGGTYKNFVTAGSVKLDDEVDGVIWGPVSVNPLDADGDGVQDDHDICLGHDDNLDSDGDGVPDGCDVCLGDDSSGDFDSDGYCLSDDCDDTDTGIHTSLVGYVDGDNDTYTIGGSQSLCTDGTLPIGFIAVQKAEDCDDSNDLIYPGAPDPLDSVDQNCVNDAPVFVSTQVTSVNEDSLYSYSIRAQDVDHGNNLVITGVVPGWLHLTDNVDGTATLSGTPLNDHVGERTVELTVTDKPGATDTQIFTVSVANTNDAPVVTSEEIITATEDIEYSYIFTASDVDVGDALILSAPVLPSWLGFNSATGVLAGTPLNNNVGDNPVELVVTDLAGETDSQIFTISVANINDDPVISGTPAITVDEDSAYSFTPTASDVDAGDSLSFTITNKPGWVSLDPVTGGLSGTPLNDDVATTTGIVITVTDIAGGSASLPAFDLEVVNTNDAPVFTSEVVTSATEDIAYSYSVTTTDVDVGDTLVITEVTPGWLTLADNGDGTATLSGTPLNAQVGDHTVELTVTDGAGATDIQTFTVSVTNTNDAPVVTSTKIESATEDIEYSYTFTASDIDVGDALILSAPVLPSWLGFNSATGVLAGTPLNNNVGDNPVELVATDIAGETDSQIFTISVANINDDPVISGTPVLTVEEDSVYSFTPTASDVDAGDSLSFTITNKPSWANLDPTTGKLSGTPLNGDVGTTTGIVITVTDTTGASASLPAFSLEVLNTNDAPLFSSTQVTSAVEDIEYRYNVTASDVDVGDTLTISNVSPSWLSLTDNGDGTAILSGTPLNAQVGDHTVELTVTDDAGATDIQTFTVSVTNTNDDPVISGTPSTTVDEDSAYSFTPIASDVDAGDSLSFTITNKPGWASLDPVTGKLSGTPLNDDVGTTAGIVITVADTAGGSASLPAFALEIVNTNDAPVFTSEVVTSATEDIAYSYSVTTTDVDVGDTLVITDVTPGWLTLSDNGDGTATLSGTPLNSHVGDHSVELTVTDGAGATDIQTFTVSVTNTNDAPVVTSTKIESATEDIEYSYTFTASDIDVGDALILSAPVLPSWLGFNSATGILSGTPLNSNVGDNPVELVVTDLAGETDTQIFTINVANINDDPVISGTPATTVDEDSAYSFTPTSSDIDAGDSLSFTITNKPGWASLDPATGELSGTPLNGDVGTTTGIVITVTDTAGGSASLPAFALEVVNTNDAPVFTSTEVTKATEDIEYNYSVTATDVDVEDTLVITDVTPGWLTLADNGDGTATLSGTPLNRHVGDHSVELTVFDSAGATDVQIFTVSVANTNDAPVISVLTDQRASEGERFVFDGKFTDIDVGDTHTIQWDFGDGAVETGVLKVGHSYGDNGTYTVTITVTDSAGMSSSSSCEARVKNAAPIAGLGPDRSVPANIEVKFEVDVIDPGVSDTFSYSWNFGDGYSLETTEFSTSHIYTGNETYQITVSVTDDDGGVGTDSIMVNSVYAGDVNDDGFVDLADLVLALQIVIDDLPANSAIFNAADVNGDGKIDIQDATLILRNISSGQP